MSMGTQLITPHAATGTQLCACISARGCMATALNAGPVVVGLCSKRPTNGREVPSTPGLSKPCTYNRTAMGDNRENKQEMTKGGQ